MREKTRIELALLLPSVPDARNACVTRLCELLKGHEGIESAHPTSINGKEPGQICIHYDPDRVSVGEVRDLARRVGVQLDNRFGHMFLNLKPMHARQSRKVESRARRLNGVLEAVASPVGLLRIEFDREVIDEDAVRASVKKLGVRILEKPKPSTPSEVPSSARKPLGKDGEHPHGGVFSEQGELVLAALCGGFLLIGWLLPAFANVTPWVTLSFYLAAYFCGGIFLLRDTFKDIRVGRFDIDFLMLVAAVGAGAIGEWAEGALLIFLFSLGRGLEHFAMGRARRAIEALAELAPETALVRSGNSIKEVPVEQLVPGDVVIVKPDERLPADGFVIQGEGSINQAPITGESVPVDKRPVSDRQNAAANPDRLDPQHRVFAGTINGSGALEIQVTKLASESTLARVVQMVNEAETQKSPTQRFAEKFEHYYVPVVLTVVVLLLFAWVVINEPFSASFYRAMAVLVGASPCALAISTPSAVLSGVARAARGGVLIKGGGPLENLAAIGAIAFDKTGTLTEGKPRLTDVVTSAGATEEELLRLAIAVESLSDHPLAAAVVYGGKERLKNDAVPQAYDVQSITGRGVKATVEHQPIYIGKETLFTEVEGPPIPQALHECIEKLKADGRTTMIVRRGEKYLGVLGLMDTPRDEAKTVIARLRDLGIRRMIMLSGDNQQVASAVAKEVGLDEALGDLMPNDKVAAIKTLSTQMCVAMMGDGVNDAPAMANATVGIAMGAAGSNVALETADVALMADDLSQLPFAIGLGRQTSRIIRQNVWFSLGMVAFLVPASTLGLRLGLAVVLHEGSTLLVVLNALRLLAYRAK